MEGQAYHSRRGDQQSNQSQSESASKSQVKAA